MKDIVRIFLISAIFFLLTLFYAPLTLAQYALDQNFGTGGIQQTNLGFTNSYPMALQQDGKILQAGYIGSNFAIARYNLDGSLDTSFGSNGIFSTDLGDSSCATGAVVRSDGKIFFVGSKGVEGLCWGLQFLTGLLNSNGTIDTSYGTNGYTYTPVSGYSVAHSWSPPIIQSDLKSIIVGSVANNGDDDPILLRFNSNGTLDQTFGNGGMYIGPQTGAYDYFEASAIQSDGKIVAVGAIDNTNNLLISRFNLNGTLDTSFGTNGQILTNYGNIRANGDDVAIQPDNKILVSGYVSDTNTTTFLVSRYNPDGSLDTSFAENGVLINSFGSVDTIARNILIQPDGKIILGGYDGTSYSSLNGALRRINANGTVDSTFGTNGSIIVSSGFIEFQQILPYNNSIIVGGPNSNASTWVIGKYNSTEISATDQINNLINLTKSFNLQQGINNSLDSKLNVALDSLNDVNQNNNQAAINTLNAFIDAVEAQRGNKITNEQADSLISAAQEIITKLSS